MKKHFFNVLLLGALTTLSASFVQSCTADVDNLKTRVTVLEGMVRDLQKDLQAAMVTGSTIVSSAQAADGTWTLVLSDGNTITIKPSTGSAGGAAISVEETDDAIVITVDGQTYALPKKSSGIINSVVYVPEYADGKVIVGNDGANVSFLVTPALTSAQVANAVVEIADAREVKTRAGAGLFKVESVAADGDLLVVGIKGLAAESGKIYTVAIKITVDGATISSNYFNVAVGDDFSFESEVLVDPVMVDGVQLTKLDGELEGYHRALIPESAFKFAGTFNLKDYYKTLPEGNIAFQLAPAELQNDNVRNHYDAINAALSADGTWKPVQRLGTDAWNSEGKNGIIIYMTANDVIKNKIFWQIDNPIPGMGLDKFLGDGFPEAQHMEIGTEQSVNLKWILPAGAQVVDLTKLFLTATFPEGELLPDPIYLRHGNANKAIQMIQEASFQDQSGEDFAYADGDHFTIGDKYKPLVARSRGFVWRTTQPSWVSSIRENWPDEAKAACNGPANGEILGGWDGGGDIPGLMGWDINERGLVTTDAYQGWGFRSGVGVFFEYEYGEQTLGPWHWAYVFFNRRVAPYEEGKGIDPDAR